MTDAEMVAWLYHEVTDRREYHGSTDCMRLRAIAARLAELTAERDAARAEAARLREALEPFASGENWGALKAWIVCGCDDRAIGIAAAREITQWQVAADAALAGGSDDA